MNKKLRILALNITLQVALGGIWVLTAQEPPIAGGYSETSVTAPEVAAAAKVALKERKRKTGTRLTLVAIEHAEAQVVAGLNYRLCLKVKSKGKVQRVTAVVYRDLREKYKLSSWEAGCKSGG